MFFTHDDYSDAWIARSTIPELELARHRCIYNPTIMNRDDDPRYATHGLVMLSTPFQRHEFYESINSNQQEALGISDNALHGGLGIALYPRQFERTDANHAWAVPYAITPDHDDPSKRRIFKDDGFNYWVQEPKWLLPDDSELNGWLICHMKKGSTPARAVIERCMRISVIVNLLQRYEDPQQTFDWFAQIDQWVGMPRLLDDGDVDDLAWEQSDRAIDPLSLLNSGEVARLWNFTVAAGEMDDVGAAVANTHTQMRLTRVLPYRIVRIGSQPHPFAFAQAIGFTDVETLAFASHIIKTPVVELDRVDGDKPGDVILAKQVSAVGLHESIFDLKREGWRASSSGDKRLRNWSVYTSPEVMSRQSIEAPFIIGNGIHQETGDSVYGFSSFSDGYAHRLAEDFAHHPSMASYFTFLGDAADPSLWTPTWKDRRPLKVLDYAKPFPSVWSDLLRCDVCNQRVRVLFSNENAVPSVCCPSCKAEDGIKTEHLMSGNIPAVLGISSTTDGTTIME